MLLVTNHTATLQNHLTLSNYLPKVASHIDKMVYANIPMITRDLIKYTDAFQIKNSLIMETTAQHFETMSSYLLEDGGQIYAVTNTNGDISGLSSVFNVLNDYYLELIQATTNE